MMCGHRVAFAVSMADFTAIVDPLREQKIGFGYDPEDPTNGQTEDVCTFAVRTGTSSR